MSTISEQEVTRLAGLAHIALTEEDVKHLATDLDHLAEWVAKIQEADTQGVPSTSHPMPLTNVWREDEVGAVLDREEVLDQAPEAESGMFQVPQILGEE